MFIYEIVTFIFMIFLKSCFQESAFINSVHDVVNYNSECHIHILLQAPFYFPIYIKNPLTIRLLSKVRSENVNSLLQDNSTLSIVNVRGIHCIYFVLLQPHKKTSGIVSSRQSLDRSDAENYTPVSNFGSIPFFNIFSRFFGIKDRLNEFDGFLSMTGKISQVIIFTRLNNTDLPGLAKILHQTNHEVSRKVGFVLLSDSDFELKNSQASKKITHLMCHNCFSKQLDSTISDKTFILSSLNSFVDYLQSVNERRFLIYTSKKIVLSLMTVGDTKKTHPMVVSRKLRKDFESSSTLREILDYFMLLNIIEYRNLSVEISEFGRRSDNTELLASTRDLELTENFYLEEGEVLLLEATTHSFLTCFNVPIVSISFFVSPFDPIVWVLFICSAGTITVVWLVISQLSGKRNAIKSFSPTLFMISSIMDDSCGIPNWLAKQISFRFSFVAWFLAVIVIVNGYISVLISGLTSPFDLKTIRYFQNLTIPYYNYQDIIKNRLWCNMGCGPSSAYYDAYGCGEEVDTENLTPRKFDEERDFRILSTALGHTGEEYLGQDTLTCNHTRMQWKTSSFMSKLIKFQQKSCIYDPLPDLKYSRSVSMFEELLFNLIFPSHNGIPQSGANLYLPNPFQSTCELKDNNQFEIEVEKELLKCGKVVFADEHRIVLLEYEYLEKQYRNVSFFLSEQIWPQQRYWEFKTIFRHPIIFEGMQTFLSNGIYFRSLGYFEASKYFERARVYREKYLQENDALKPVVLVLEGKFKSLFYVFLGLFLTLILFVLLEIYFKYLRWSISEIKQKICLLFYLVQHLQYIYTRQIIAFTTRLIF